MARTSARWRRPLLLGALSFGGGLALLATFVAWQARERAAHPPKLPADAALILGNRAYIDGVPNPCLVSRIARGLELVRSGQVQQLAMTGGVDGEDGRTEAQVMATLAREAGFGGTMVLESRSQSTRENLALSWPLLKAAGVRRVIIVSDDYHLWRVQRLAKASGFDGAFEVQYAASDSRCTREPSRALWRTLREPLAIVNNALNGDFFSL